MVRRWMQEVPSILGWELEGEHELFSEGIFRAVEAPTRIDVNSEWLPKCGRLFYAGREPAPDPFERWEWDYYILLRRYPVVIRVRRGFVDDESDRMNVFPGLIPGWVLANERKMTRWARARRAGG